MNRERDDLIHICHALGFTQRETVIFLAQNHGYMLAERHLRHLLKEQNLIRTQRNDREILRVASFISHQLRFSGRQHGYRMMHLKCKLSGYKISRENIRILLSILDPEGVELRTKRRLVRRRYYACGPNENWHIDSYDKLTPYGIGINGC